MKWVDRYMMIVQRVLPSPLAIALILTSVTAILALFVGPQSSNNLWNVGQAWYTGVWELLTFTMQMMLMLVLGHIIALSTTVDKLTRTVAALCTSNSKAALFVTLFSVMAGYLNWGLGLIFGAILARKVGEVARERNVQLNYPLIGACGYTALMVWHGGLSGSAPLTVSSPNHSLVNEMGMLSISETILASPNLIAIVCTLVILPLTALVLARRSFKATYPKKSETSKVSPKHPQHAEKIDHMTLVGRIVGIAIIALWIRQWMNTNSGLAYFNLNNINLLLFGVAFLVHGSLFRFKSSAAEAIQGSTGILIQFPLYAGIMGIMKYTGLLEVFANFFTEISTANTFPFFAYFSSAFVNILVPSGGGQWQVQGPILIEAAQSLGIPLKKTVMALAYGDQLTNMLQPFWALPLLGITGLKAKDILPYSLIFMFVGGWIYIAILYLF